MVSQKSPFTDELAVARASKRREALTRARITQAARELIEQHGIENFTVRGLGASLQVEAMSLYRHVPSRAAILADVSEGLVPGGVPVSTPDWQGYLHELAHVIRRTALEHPNVFVLAAQSSPTRSWLRAPLHGLPSADAFFGALRSCGLPDPAVVHTYRAFTAFLLGDLLLEVTADPHDDTISTGHRAARQRREFDATLDDLLASLSLED